MPENLACSACQRFCHTRHVGYEFLIRTLASRGAGEKVTLIQNLLTGHANFCCMPIQMQKHSGATPSIASEQVIDDRHEKNFCVLTKTENVAEMSSVAESCPREGS